MCGFVHATFVTTPVSLIFFVPSYSVLNEWCASTGPVRQAMTPRPAVMIPIVVLMPTSSLSLVGRREGSRLSVLVVFETDEFEQVQIGANVSGGEFQCHRLRKSSGVDEG